MPGPRQVTFDGGEVSPDVYARVDLPLYQRALRTCRNFIPTPGGKLVNRPGLPTVAEVKTSAKRTRVIPFVFSGEQSYVLELGDQYLRIYYQAAYLTELDSPFLEGDLFTVGYTQSGDIVTLVHPLYKPQELKRTDHVTWSIADKDFGAIQEPPTGPGNNLLDTTTTPLKPWSWGITAFDADGDESTPSAYKPAASHVTDTTPAEVKWSAPTGTAPVLYGVYRGQNGLLGYVGAATASPFRDDGQVPDFAQQPPTYPNPFASAGNYPSQVAYHEQRLWFGGTLNNPVKLWGSVTGLFRLFESHQPPLDDDAIIFSLAIRQKEELRGLLPLGGALIALTNAAEYPARGAGENEPLSATSITAPPHSYCGSSRLQPIGVGNVALFVQDVSNHVRDLTWNIEANGYAGNDLSLFAGHLLDGHAIVDWAYAKRPYGVVWAVRDDGVLLELTVNHELNVVGWSRHDTFTWVTQTPSKFESVCVVPEGGEDVAYFIVQRTSNAGTKRYLERMATRRVTDVRLGNFLDASVSFDGRNITGTTITISDLGSGYGVGATVRVQSSAALFQSPWDTARDWVFVGGGGRNSCRLKLTTVANNQDVTCVVYGTDVPVGFRALATTAWSRGINRMSVPAALDAPSLTVLRDGEVTSGGVQGTTGAKFVDWTQPAAIVCVGLPITAQAELLDYAAGSSARGAPKLTTRVGFDVEMFKTSGVLELGYALGTSSVGSFPRTLQARASAGAQYIAALGVTAAQLAPAESTAVIPVTTAWRVGGRAFLQSSDPLPLAITSCWRDLEVGGEP